MVTLIKNAVIKTMDKANPEAQAVVIDGNRFAYVGTNDGAAAFVAGEHTVIDAGGQLMIPGLNDSHMHMIHYAKNMRSVMLHSSKSVSDVVRLLHDGLAKRSADDTTWFEGEGWNQDFFTDEQRFPNRADLDQVSTDIPIMIMRACFHIGILNTPALRAIGLSKETAAQYGDLVEVDASGEPTGIIKESFLDDTKAKISSLNLEIMKDIIVRAQQFSLAQGITSVQSDDVGYTPNGDYDMLARSFLELEKEGKLKMRLGEQALLQKPHLIQGFFDKGYKQGWGTEKYNITSIKVLIDGSLGARTAAMRKPYNDDPSTRGLTLFTEEELDTLVMLAHKNHCPAAIHAIGDGAIEMALNAIEKAQKAYPDIKVRHGVVHVQITDTEMLRRFKELDALAYVQPIFIDYDMNVVESRVGAELTKTSYAWKTMVDLGVHASFGTDCPVESFNTMPNIYSAVARKNISGDIKRVFLQGQRVSMEEAIWAYTMEGAYASNEESIKGSITVGKLADCVIFDKNLFEIDEEEILNTRAVMTFFDGELAYKA